MAMMKKPVKKYAMGGTTTSETTVKPKAKVTPRKVKVEEDVVTLPKTKQKPPRKGTYRTKSGMIVNEEKFRLPFDGEYKSGGKVKKAKSGTSLGMKSVKSGYDNNSSVTRADFVAIGKGKAKNGAMMKMGGKTPKKKMQYGGKAASMVPPKKRTMKMGGTVKKCKYGCK